MKNSIAAGIMAVVLIAVGGTGFSIMNAKENVQNPSDYMQQRMSGSQMYQMMNSAGSRQVQNQGSTFEQMLPSLKKKYPGLSEGQLKSIYEKMGDANGACSNVQGMMGNPNL